MSDEGTDIEAANGSFYQNYKSGLIDFLEFASETGRDALSSGHLQIVDAQEVQRGLEHLKNPIVDLIPLLEKRIDQSNPSFFDECTIATIWNAFGAVFLIAQHSGFTDSAKAHAHTLQGKSGGKSSGVARGKAADEQWRSECLKEAVAIRRAKPAISTSKLGTELWAAMPNKRRRPADPRTVSAFLAEMEVEGRLPKKIGRTG